MKMNIAPMLIGLFVLMSVVPPKNPNPIIAGSGAHGDGTLFKFDPR